MAIVGGTVSAIGGGKFANGAMASAFQYLFNDTLAGAQRTLKNWQNDKSVVQNIKNSLYIKQIDSSNPNSYVVTDGDSFYTSYPEAPKDLELAIGLGSSLAAGFGSVRVGSYMYTHPTESILFIRGALSGTPTTTTATSAYEAVGFGIGKLIRKGIQ
jgi:hypothetical protein